MNISFMGLGKLGLPCLLAIEDKGHTIMGYDPNQRVLESIRQRHLPYKEEKADELLSKSKIKIGTVSELVHFSDIIFVAIQTPHGRQFEGVTPLPIIRSDFDYTYL